MESLDYKHADYLSRSKDKYAMAKYGIIMTWLPRRENISVLNAGCGSGELNIMLSQNPTWRVEALDSDAVAVDLSRQMKEQFGLNNLNVFHTSIEEHQPESPYDVIICNDVLEHIEDDIAAAGKLCRMLKQGGMLCITVPALQGLFGFHDEMLGHYRRYSRGMLIQRLSRFFTVKKCRYFGASMVPVALVYSRWLRRGYPVGQENGRSIAGAVLSAAFRAESILPLPLGTSLLAQAFRTAP